MLATLLAAFAAHTILVITMVTFVPIGSYITPHSCLVLEYHRCSIEMTKASMNDVIIIISRCKLMILTNGRL